MIGKVRSRRASASSRITASRMSLDRKLIEEADAGARTPASRSTIRLQDHAIVDRTTGAMLSGEVAKRYGHARPARGHDHA